MSLDLCTLSPIPRASKSSTPTPTFNAAEHDSFLAALASCPSKPAVLSLIPPYSSKYVPKSLDDNLPMCLSQLFKSECLEMNYADLIKLAAETTITVTPAEVKLVEIKTIGQSKSRLWHRMRTGRIQECISHQPCNAINQFNYVHLSP